VIRLGHHRDTCFRAGESVEPLEGDEDERLPLWPPVGAPPNGWYQPPDSVKANLLDEDEELTDVAFAESDEPYKLNGYFTTAEGGRYLICERKSGEPPIDVELTGIWIDGPHPRERL
jgi:hypothetical protein